MTSGIAPEPRAEQVLAFWFRGGERRKCWFEKDPGFDAEIRERFLGLYEEAAAGRLAPWRERPRECLALVIVLDQFPRNMFRGSARAFAADGLALDAARRALERGDDRGMLPVERMFLYLPFEHSEALEDQRRSCELTRPLEAFAETRDAYDYAVRHLRIIERFGRFPHRNAALGRPSTPEEIEFLKQPGSGF